MRIARAALILVSGCGYCLGQEGRPGWLDDERAFCREMAARTNGKGSPVPLGPPRARRFGDHPVRPVAQPRAIAAVIGKDDWENPTLFAKVIRSESVRGPDFASRYVIVSWTCGTWCVNAVIADTLNFKTYETPFVGVVGCPEITGDHATIETHANSSLLVVRGSLEVSYGKYFDDGPCGTFYYVWNADRLRMIGCDLAGLKAR